MESETSIEVVVRVKPPSSSYLQFLDDNNIKCGPKIFTFDHLFPPTSSQNDIYKRIGTKIIANTKKGYNSCVFAYGQTGSGKTFTMTGDQQNPGLVQGCMHSLWAILQSNDTFQVKLSYYEIYSQQIRDLLLDKKKQKIPIKLKQSLTLGFHLQNIIESKVQSYEQMVAELEKGLNNRTVAETKMNSISSRSHSILTLKIVFRQKQCNRVKSSKIHFVDLAGSEKQKLTQADGQRLKEAAKINTSLTSLSMVIEKLSTKAIHIPYRDSILTKILKDSLGGNSKTILLAAVSSNENYFQQTLSTLNFAAKAKNIQLKARVNEQIDEKNIITLKKKINELEEEIQMFKEREKESSCRKCRKTQQLYDNLSKNYNGLDQQYKNVMRLFQQLEHKSSKQLILIASQLELKQIQVDQMKERINKAEEYCQQFFEDFKLKLRRTKLTQFQKQLLVLQKKKITQLEWEITNCHDLWEKKETTFKRTIQKLKEKSVISNNQISYKAGEGVTQSEAETVRSLHLKYQCQVQALEFLREREKQNYEAIQVENRKLKEELDQAYTNVEFIKQTYKNRINQLNQLHDQQSLKMHRDYSFEMDKEKQRIKQEYLQKMSTIRQQNNQKDRDLCIKQSYVKELEQTLIEEKEKLKREKTKINLQIQMIEKQKKNVERRDKNMLGILKNLGNWLDVNLTKDNFTEMANKITKKIEHFQAIQSKMKQQ